MTMAKSPERLVYTIGHSIHTIEKFVELLRVQKGQGSGNPLEHIAP